MFSQLSVDFPLLQYVQPGFFPALLRKMGQGEGGNCICFMFVCVILFFYIFM